jgi:hypothetical protein
VKTDRGCIVIDGYGKTNVPGIYAIGDVAGPPMLAHKAEHEAVICVEKIAGLPNVHPMDKLKIPGCTYCNPQVASVGLTEAKAKEQGRDIRVGRFPFVANGKAIALGEDQGMVKTIFDKKTGELLGAHLVGAEVTELIQGFVVAMNLETTEEDLMHTIFPHPTISENDEGERARRLWTGAERVSRRRRLPRLVILPVLGGAGLGAVAGLTAIRGRGAVEFGTVRLEGMAGIAAVSAILALMGLMLGLTFWLIMRALHAAANGDRR